MSPVRINIMLHYYCSPDDYEGKENAQFIEQTLQNFYSTGLLYHSEKGESKAVYTITQKGRVYVEALINIPVPILIRKWGFPEWEMPLVDLETDEEIGGGAPE